MNARNCIGESAIPPRLADGDSGSVFVIRAGFTERLVTALFATERFVVIERRDLHKILREQDFAKKVRVEVSDEGSAWRVVRDDASVFDRPWNGRVHHTTIVLPERVTARYVRLTLDDVKGTDKLMDMLLAKKRAGDRKSWLESKGDLAEALL
jgi:hypothetical protein